MVSRTKRPDQVNRRDGNEAAAVVGDQLSARVTKPRHQTHPANKTTVNAIL